MVRSSYRQRYVRRTALCPATVVSRSSSSSMPANPACTAASCIAAYRPSGVSGSRWSLVTTSDGEPSPWSGPTYVTTDRSIQPSGSPSVGLLGAGDRLVVNELDVRHRGSVARPRAELHDPRVATGPLGEPGRHLVEQTVHRVLAAEVRHRLPLRRH